MMRRLSLLLGLLLGPALHARPQGDAAPTLTANTTTLEPGQNAVVFTGNAQLTDGHSLLQADEIRYLYASNTAIATGHVCLTRGTERVLADKMIYRRADHTYTVERVRLGRYPYYISGVSAEGDARKIVVHDARLSVLEPGPYQPTIVAETLRYQADGVMNLEHAHVGIGDVQPLTVAKFSQSLNLPLVSYFSLNAGYSSALGVIGEVGLHLPVAEDVSVGGKLGVYTARGVMAGPAAHYDTLVDGNAIAGDLQSGFINDHGDRLTDVLGRPVPANRGYVQWTHDQNIADNLNISAQVNYWSDSEVLRDFVPDTFFRVQAPDNYVQAVYTGANYFVTAFTRAQPNNFQTVQQRLPEVRFDLMPLALGHGVYTQAQASAAVLLEDPPLGPAPTVRSTRLDAYYALTRPFAPTSWLTFTPIVGGRVTDYLRPLGGAGNYTRVLGEFGFDAALRASGVFNYTNKTWAIDGIRHLLTPKVAYRYVPGADKGRAFIPAIDTQTFGTYLPPIGLGDTRNLDQLAPTNVLRLEIDNTWQTRDPVYGSRDLLVVDFANDFYFSRTPGQPTNSDLHTFVALMPVAWLKFDFYQRVSTQNLLQQELNTGLTLHDGDAWNLRVSSNFLRAQIGQYAVQYDFRLNEAYRLVAKLDYDSLLHRFNEQSIGVKQNLGNTWSIEYLVSFYRGPRREGNFGFNLNVNALSF